MKTEAPKIALSLIRSAVYDSPLSDKEKSLCNSGALSQIFEIAKHHDVSHLTALGLKENDLLDESERDAEKPIFLAVYRYKQMNFEFVNLCKALETSQIQFIPLKGSVLRSYYPEPWMRTSCDIDVLIHKNDLDKAVSYLTDNLGYTYDHTFTHDVSMHTKNGIHIELHYSLMDDEPIKSSLAVLSNVWDTATKREGHEFWYELADDVFYFYHIAHMAKHFENGGCGIRPLIDLSILNHCISFDEDKRKDLLKKGDLEVFAEQAKRLSEVWFGDAEHTEITKKMESFILFGGVYGVKENHVAVQQQKKGGKLKYAISKIWLPYDIIKFYYPVLGKHKIFTPLMQVKRWCRLIFGGHLKRSAKELNYNSQISKEQAKETQYLLKNIGL